MSSTPNNDALINKGLALTLGLFLAAILAFDKGFSYTHIWIRGMPLFVTEFVLLLLFTGWTFRMLHTRSETSSKDWPVLVCFFLFWAVGIHALLSIPSLEPIVLVPSIKRSALFYYSFFGLLAYSLVREKGTVLSLLKWMYWGSMAAVVLHLTEQVIGLPRWWPVSVGVANDTAKAFLLFYCLFIALPRRNSWVDGIFGGLALSLLLLSGRRSTLVAIIIFATALVVLLRQPEARHNFSRLKKLAVSFAVSCFVITFLNGLPKKTDRFLFLFEPIPTSSRPLKPSKSPTASLNFSDQESDQSVSPEIWEKYRWIIDEFPEKEKFAQLFDSMDQKVFSRHGSANVGWRTKVWIEALDRTARNHFLLGAGVYRPIVITSVSPYKKPARIVGAASKLDRQFNFYLRLKDKTLDPSRELKLVFPLELSESEALGEYSVYWYNIDLHNSHLAIFYRFGIVGFFAYAGLVLLAMTSLARRLLKDADPVAFVMFFYLLWYLSVATFNVVLEGPFMGSVFWIFLGLALSYSRRRQPTAQRSATQPIPENPRSPLAYALKEI